MIIAIDCINYELIHTLISNIALLIYIVVVIFVMKKLLNLDFHVTILTYFFDILIYTFFIFYYQTLNNTKIIVIQTKLIKTLFNIRQQLNIF